MLEYRCLPLNFPRTLVGSRCVLTANQLLDTRDICCSPYWPTTTATSGGSDSVNRSTVTPSTGQTASIVLTSRSRLDLHQALLANFFRKRRELWFFSTHNAFITILSSRVILAPSDEQFPRCVSELLSHSPKIIEFYLSIQILQTKM